MHYVAKQADPIVTAEQFGAWLAAQDRQPTLWYLDAVPLIRTAAGRYGVDWLVPALMCWHETAAGAFGGHVTPAMCNPCGLRVEPELMRELETAHAAADDPAVRRTLMRASHASFATVALGVEAFLQHVVAYLGPDHGYDERVWRRGLVDPRWHIVRRLGLTIGADATVEQLGQSWASSGYGAKLDRWCTEAQQMLTPTS